MSLNTQSQETDDVLNKSSRTGCQPTEASQQTFEIPRNETNKENVVEKNVKLSCEPASGSAHNHGNLFRRRSFCKVPGLRRSARTKRFSYPTASQVAEKDTGKRTREAATADVISPAVKDENSTVKFDVINCVAFGDRTGRTTRNSKDREGEMPLSKKLKSGTKMFCKSEVDEHSLSSATNDNKKDEVLFDMDILSQFPVESICSPPFLNSASFNSVAEESRVRLEKNVVCSEGNGDIQACGGHVLLSDTTPLFKENESNTVSSHNERTSGKQEELTESYEIIKPVYFDNANEPSLCPKANAKFQSTEGKEIEMWEVTHNSTLALFEESDLLTARSVAHTSTEDKIVGVDSRVEESNLTEAAKFKITVPQEPQNRMFSTSQAGSDQLFGRFSPETKGSGNVKEKYGDFKPCVTNKTFSGFAGFQTASGKHVSVSSEALAKAKATMQEIDSSLGLCGGMWEQPARDRTSTSCKATQSKDNLGVSYVADVSLQQRGDETSVAKRENISGFEKEQSLSSGFYGFSTASGKQVHITESAMKKARRTLSEVDAKLEASGVAHGLEVTNEKEGSSFNIKSRKRAAKNGLESAFPERQCYAATENSRTLDGELENSLLKEPTIDVLGLQEVSCIETKKDWVASFPSFMADATATEDVGSDLASAANKMIEEKQYEDLSLEDKSNVDLCTTRARDTTLQDAKHAVDDHENKQSENVNDSLLEDLLNDCKRSRQDSLATISEESEIMEEHRENTTSKVHDPYEVKHRHCNDKDPLECHGNILTECCLSDVARNNSTQNVVFQTASAKSVCVSEAALSKAKNAWNKIDQELALDGAVNIQHRSLEKLNDCETVPARPVESRENEVILEVRHTAISNSSRLSRLKTGNGKTVENSVDALQPAGDQKKSWTYLSTNSSEFKRATDIFVKTSEHDFNAAGCITNSNVQGIVKDEQYKPDHVFSTFSGFQTAGGKKVTLSEAALRRGTDIMKRIAEDPQDGHLDENNWAYGINGCVSEEYPERTDIESTKPKNENDDVLGFQPPYERKGDEPEKASESTAFIGFQTAGGKRIHMTENALRRGAQIMQQINSSLEKGVDKLRQANVTGVPSFQSSAVKGFGTLDGAPHQRAQMMRRIDNSFEQMEEKGEETTTELADLQTSAEKTLNSNEDSARKAAQTVQKISKSMEQSEGKTGLYTTSLTGFSGFQTAAGKSINISKESLEKGVAIMQQIDRSIEQNSGSNSGSDTGFSGFQTASGSSVKLSKESMEKGAAIMQQIDKSLQDRDYDVCETGFSSFQTASGQKVKLSKESMERGAAIMQQIDNSLRQSRDTSISSTGFSGFQTASGQKVKLSEESMEKGGAIMQQIDNSLQQKRDTSVSSTGFSGFQTASGQKVKLSKESLEKGTAIMQQIDNSLQQRSDTSVSSTGFFGFQTASGQKVKLSKESMEKGASIMQQIDNSLQQRSDNSVSSTGFSGFQTPCGQKVKLSEESMEKGASIMQQIDNSLQQKRDTSISSTGFSGFQTASGQKVKLSEESMEKGAAIMQQIDNSLQQKRDTSVSSTGFSGFQTSSGQKVTLSKESMEKGAAIMQQIDNSLQQRSDTSISSTGFSGFQTASGQKLKLSKESLEKGAAIMQQIDNSLPKRDATVFSTGFSGFQTASGQKVKLSKESIEKGMAMMRQIDKSIEQNKYSSTCTSFSTCSSQTVNGQNAQLSKESFAKGAAIVQQIDKSLQQHRDGSASANSFTESKTKVSSFSGFSGFQTASGKTVQISESALAKAKETMTGIERDIQEHSVGTALLSDDSSSQGTEGKKTDHRQASNSTTFITKGIHGGKFEGSTAGGQKVSVSNEALMKAKAFLQETDSAFKDSKTEHKESCLLQREVPTGVPGRTTPPPDRRCSVEHDEAVSREVLESSEALLAYESALDVSEYDRATIEWGSFNTSADSLVGIDKGEKLCRLKILHHE